MSSVLRKKEGGTYECCYCEGIQFLNTDIQTSRLVAHSHIVDPILPAAEVDSASNRNEYQESLKNKETWGQSAAGA
jgi:hypothetical protein